VNTSAYQACLDRYQDSAQTFASAMETLVQRDSLSQLSEEGFAKLTPAIVKWLLRAESHEGSELVYTSHEGRARVLPLNSYFDFPDKYADKMPEGAFLSVELSTGSSLVLYMPHCDRESTLRTLEAAENMYSLTTDRPLRERILAKLETDGHLSYLSQDGLKNLNAKLVKYLDYAVNVRPGSEIIYFSPRGFVNGDALEKVSQNPAKFDDVPKPVYLAIEVAEQSVIFDTHDVTPANIWHLMKKARQIVHQRQAKI